MRETDFAGAGPASAAHQSAGHRLDASDVEGFAERQPRQDRRQRAGQQRLARARRPLHETVVAAGTGDLQGSLGQFLPTRISQIRVIRGLSSMSLLQELKFATDSHR